MTRHHSARSARSKMLTREAAAAAVRAAQRDGLEVVFTNGCFDLLHIGHVRTLERARGLGDRLIVALNSDSSVRRIKGPERPIVPLRRRMEVVAALECVDWAISFRASTPLSLIRTLRPDVLVKGGDWRLDQIVGRDEVESWGGRVVRMGEIPGTSTSDLLEQLRR